MPHSPAESAPPTPAPRGERLLALAPPPTTDLKVLRSAGSLVHLRTIERLDVPRIVRPAFVLLGVLAALLTAQQLTSFAGDSRLVTLLFDHGANNVVLLGAGALTAWRAIRFSSERAAWSLIAAALVLYCAGDIVWSLWFADSDAAVTVADAFWVCFAPLSFGGLVLLTRSRISRFELARWIDGIAAAILIATPAVVLILEPTIRQSDDSLLVEAVTVFYPLGDIILLGATVGVIALAGWRPGWSWLLLTLGFTSFVIADSIYAVQNLTTGYQFGAYDFLWPVAALLMAAAAWTQPVRHEEVHAWGWRAVALPILCQLAPIGLLVLDDEPASEQLLTMAVLVIVLVQLVSTRPRRPAHAE